MSLHSNYYFWWLMGCMRVLPQFNINLLQWWENLSYYLLFGCDQCRDMQFMLFLFITSLLFTTHLNEIILMQMCDSVCSNNYSKLYWNRIKSIEKLLSCRWRTNCVISFQLFAAVDDHDWVGPFLLVFILCFSCISHALWRNMCSCA